MAQWKKTITLSNGKSFVTMDGTDCKEWLIETLSEEWIQIRSVFAPGKNDAVCIRKTDISCIEFEELTQ